jgi:hypothetical protein
MKEIEKEKYIREEGNNFEKGDGKEIEKEKTLLIEEI